VTDKKGKVTFRPLTPAEKTQINDLAMQAMGFNKERGDALTVVNSSFAGEPVEVLPETPIWKNPEAIEYGKDTLKLIIGVVALMMIYKRLLKPMAVKLMAGPPKLKDAPATEALTDQSSETQQLESPEGNQNLAAARQLAKDNPRMVAGVVAGWTNG
jgi:flagellar M-ring protein FliF